MRTSSLILVLTMGCTSDQALTDSESIQPEIMVDSPTPASWHPTGITILTGEVRNIRRISVNGQLHELNGNQFAIPIQLNRGINFLELEAVGGDGRKVWDRRSVIAGEFVNAEGAVENAVAVRINEGGLVDAADIIAAAMDPQSITQDISPMNPIVELDYTLGTDVAIDLNNMYFNTPIIDIDGEDHQFEIEIILPNLFVDTDAQMRVLWMESEHALEIVADHAVIDVDLSLWAQHGTVHAEATNTQVRLEGFAYDVSLLPGEIVENHMFEDSVREAIETNLSESMQTMLPEIFADMQQDLEIDFDVDLMGTVMHIAAETNDVGVDDVGLWMGLDLEFSAESNTSTGDGYVYSGTQMPNPDTRADGAVVISDDALNRVVYELWESGSFAQTMSTEDGTLNADDLDAFGVSQLTITTNPELPPVFIESDGVLDIQFGALEVTMLMPGFDYGDYLILEIAGSVGVDLVFDAGSIRPILSELEFSLDVIDTNWVQEQESIVNLMGLILNPELLLGAIEDVSIPVPAIDELTIESAEIERSGNGTHTSLKLNISPD